MAAACYSEKYILVGRCLDHQKAAGRLLVNVPIQVHNVQLALVLQPVGRLQQQRNVHFLAFAWRCQRQKSGVLQIQAEGRYRLLFFVYDAHRLRQMAVRVQTVMRSVAAYNKKKEAIQYDVFSDIIRKPKYILAISPANDVVVESLASPPDVGVVRFLPNTARIKMSCTISCRTK